MSKKLDANGIINAIDEMLAEKRKISSKLSTQVSEDKAYSFFLNDKTNARFFFSTGKRVYNGKLEYVAGIYNYNFLKQEYILMSSVGFRHKDEAIAWAKKQYELSI